MGGGGGGGGRAPSRAFQTTPALALPRPRVRLPQSRTRWARAGPVRARTSAELAPGAPDRAPSRRSLPPRPPPRMPAAAPLCSAAAAAAGRPAPGSRLQEARQDRWPCSRLACSPARSEDGRVAVPAASPSL